MRKDLLHPPLERINAAVSTAFEVFHRIRLGTDTRVPMKGHASPPRLLPAATVNRSLLRPKRPTPCASTRGATVLSPHSQLSLKHSRMIRKRVHCAAPRAKPTKGPMKGTRATPPKKVVNPTPTNHDPIPEPSTPKAPYVRRDLYMKGVRPNILNVSELDRLPVVFQKGDLQTNDVWQTALLFWHGPGLFRTAEAAGIEIEDLELCFRTSMSKRCATEKTQRDVAKTVSAYVSFANQMKAPFFGEAALFSVIQFLTASRRRGPSIPKNVRWALKVYNEILSIGLPLTHPGVLAATKTPVGGSLPKPTKRAPLLELPFIKALENMAADESIVRGKRTYAATYLLMCLASLRFADTKVVFHLWLSKTAVCGVSLDLKLHSRPIIEWATPITALGASNGHWADTFIQLWGSDPPKPGGSRSLFYHVDKNRNLHPTKRAPSALVIKSMRTIAAEIGFSDIKLTTHSARNFFPTCSAQLGWSEENRRTVGHWAEGSVMPNVYDRAFCVTELRLRNNILQKIQNGWVPTQSFEVPMEIDDSGSPLTNVKPNERVKIQADQDQPTQIYPEVKNPKDGPNPTPTEIGAETPPRTRGGIRF